LLSQENVHAFKTEHILRMEKAIRTNLRHQTTREEVFCLRIPREGQFTFQLS
jgi:hypothetical protein